MPIIRISTQKIYGNLKPSTDTPTHLEIYKIYKIKYRTQSFYIRDCLGPKWKANSFIRNNSCGLLEVPIVNHLSKKDLIKIMKNTGKLIFKT